MEIKRCSWVSESEIYKNYHDNDWGNPIFDDNKLFEYLSLEIFQAGLSWLTILKKKKKIFSAFDNFNIQKVSSYSKREINILLQNDTIIRHKQKINSVINNAKKIIDIQNTYISFEKFIWSFSNFKTIKSNKKTQFYISNKLLLKMKKLGFKFIGEKIIFSFLESCGVFDNHSKYCFKNLKK